MNTFVEKSYDFGNLRAPVPDSTSSTLNLAEVFPIIAKRIASVMLVRHVALWLPANYSDMTYRLYYYHSPTNIDERRRHSTIRRARDLEPAEVDKIFEISGTPDPECSRPIENEDNLRELGITRYVFVENNNEFLAILGVSKNQSRDSVSAKNDRFLLKIRNQMANLIIRHKVTEELSLRREWDSFHRLTAFIIHDLKNLATLQSMTLENAKHLNQNPDFVADAFATFTQTTDKMISLIASLSIQRGQFTLNQQPVNILEVIHNTFEDLKLAQRTGVMITTKFPPQDAPPIILGDPELLQKVFTNILLNAIQSLPKGQGAVDISVGATDPGKIIAAIRDTGCGIPPEQLQNVFRPFQTTKERGMGIGMCHTRSIVEVHGGHIRIDSQVNRGTTVELEFPRI
jgi:signal transduction histidine kinase